MISILIPIKNAERFLRACLNSVLRQTVQDWECLVLDNNSTDGSIELVKGYEQKTKGKIKPIQCGFDSPPIKYNLAIRRHVKGEDILLIDADAVLEAKFIEKLLVPLREKKVAGSVGMILTANKEKFWARIIGYELQDRYDKLPRKIKRCTTMGVIFKKKILEKAGLFNEKLKTGYDCEIGYKINDLGYEIIFVPQAKIYHHHRESLSAYWQQQKEYGFYAVKRYLEKPKIAQGDEVTPFSMIIQPAIYFLFFILFLFSLWARHFTLFIFASIVLLAYYLWSAGRLVTKYHDKTAFLAVILLVIRPLAWLMGGVSYSFKKYL